MNKRTTYSRAELEFVLDYIKCQGTAWIDTGEGSPIRNLAGESERDYNITLLCGILQRMGVYGGQRQMADWLAGVGYTRTIRIRITDKHLDEVTAGRVQADGQISIF